MWPEISSVKLENKRELNLNGEKFTKLLKENGDTLDASLVELVQLNFLQLSNSARLREIPDGIQSLENLQSLLLFGNSLCSLPASIEQLHKLKVLDVSSNQLTEFKFDFTKMDQLLSVNLCNNLLTTFSLKAPMLHVLNLAQNSISQFPEVIPPSVTDLNISKNKMSELPHDLQLPNLKNLDLSENLLSAVPKNLGRLKLKILNLKQNPLKDKKLYKFVDQNQALKAIMDHIMKLGISSPAPTVDNEDKNQNDSKASETEKAVTSNKIVITKADDMFKIVQEISVENVRGFIICCIISNVQLTTASLKEFLQFQTKLHDGICKRREIATIATHDLDLITSKTLHYAAKPKDTIMIHPLGRGIIISANDYYTKLASEAEAIRKEKKRSQFTGIHKFLHLLEKEDNFAYLSTDTGTTLSLPPLTNSETTKLSINTKRILVEVTSGANVAICKTVMSELISKALAMGLSTSDSESKILELMQVRIVNAEGNLKTIYPSRIDLADLENATTQVIRP